jgi:uncharacterized membrane protein (UPF0127 family)
MQKMSSSHLQKLRDSFDEETVRDVLETERGLNTRSEIPDEAALVEIYNRNPRLVRWAFNTPAGREMLDWDSKFRDFLTRHPTPTPPPTPPTPTLPTPTPPTPTPPLGRPGPGPAAPRRPPRRPPGRP